MSIFSFRPFTPPPTGSFVELPGLGPVEIVSESRHGPRDAHQRPAHPPVDTDADDERFYAF